MVVENGVFFFLRRMGKTPSEIMRLSILNSESEVYNIQP